MKNIIICKYFEEKKEFISSEKIRSYGHNLIILRDEISKNYESSKINNKKIKNRIDEDKKFLESQELKDILEILNYYASAKKGRYYVFTFLDSKDINELKSPIAKFHNVVLNHIGNNMSKSQVKSKEYNKKFSYLWNREVNINLPFLIYKFLIALTRQFTYDFLGKEVSKGRSILISQYACMKNKDINMILHKNTDEEEINFDFLRDDWGKIYKDWQKEKYTFLRIMKSLLRFLRPLGIINIFQYHFNYIANVFNKYILRKTSLIFPKESSQNEQDALVGISLLSLLLILRFLPILLNNCILYLILFLVIWRLVEILVVQLSIIFLNKGDSIETANIFRSILLWLINLMEIISIYAILFLSQGTVENPLEALYFSISTISTTGFGEIIPKNGWQQFLAFTEIIIGIFMLIVFLGILISRWKNKDDRLYQLLRKVYKQKKKKMKP